MWNTAGRRFSNVATCTARQCPAGGVNGRAAVGRLALAVGHQHRRNQLAAPLRRGLAHVGGNARRVHPHVTQGEGFVDLDQEPVVFQATHLSGPGLLGVEAGPFGVQQSRRAANSHLGPRLPGVHPDGVGGLRRVCSPSPPGRSRRTAPDPSSWWFAALWSWSLTSSWSSSSCCGRGRCRQGSADRCRDPGSPARGDEVGHRREEHGEDDTEDDHGHLRRRHIGGVQRRCRQIGAWWRGTAEDVRALGQHAAQLRRTRRSWRTRSSRFLASALANTASTAGGSSGRNARALGTAGSAGGRRCALRRSGRHRTVAARSAPRTPCRRASRRRTDDRALAARDLLGRGVIRRAEEHPLSAPSRRRPSS